MVCLHFDLLALTLTLAAIQDWNVSKQATTAWVSLSLGIQAYSVALGEAEWHERLCSLAIYVTVAFLATLMTLWCPPGEVGLGVLRWYRTPGCKQTCLAASRPAQGSSWPVLKTEKCR